MTCLSISGNKRRKTLGAFISDAEAEIPSLFEVVRLLNEAKSDSSVKGLYILAADNANGFSASEELRKAVLDFKKSRKFVLAYGETMTQKAYYVANAAERVYVHPQGGLEWSGFSSNLFFLKGMLDKLQIEPQIFYAGKFKSATEPLRETKMTEANRLQTAVWLGDLYASFLRSTAASRNIDSAILHQLAINGTIQTAVDAQQYKLVDGLKYDDEVKGEMLKWLKKDPKSSIEEIGQDLDLTSDEVIELKNEGIREFIKLIVSTGIFGNKDKNFTDNFVQSSDSEFLDDFMKKFIGPN